MQLTYNGCIAGSEDGHINLWSVATDVENISTLQFIPGKLVLQKNTHSFNSRSSLALALAPLEIGLEQNSHVPAPSHIITDHKENRSCVFFTEELHPCEAKVHIKIKP